MNKYYNILNIGKVFNYDIYTSIFSYLRFRQLILFIYILFIFIILYLYTTTIYNYYNNSLDIIGYDNYKYFNFGFSNISSNIYNIFHSYYVENDILSLYSSYGIDNKLEYCLTLDISGWRDWCNLCDYKGPLPIGKFSTSYKNSYMIINYIDSGYTLDFGHFTNYINNVNTSVNNNKYINLEKVFKDTLKLYNNNLNIMYLSKMNVSSLYEFRKNIIIDIYDFTFMYNHFKTSALFYNLASNFNTAYINCFINNFSHNKRLGLLSSYDIFSSDRYMKKKKIFLYLKKFNINMQSLSFDVFDFDVFKSFKKKNVYLNLNSLSFTSMQNKWFGKKYVLNFYDGFKKKKIYYNYYRIYKNDDNYYISFSYLERILLNKKMLSYYFYFQGKTRHPLFIGYNVYSIYFDNINFKLNKIYHILYDYRNIKEYDLYDLINKFSYKKKKFINNFNHNFYVSYNNIYNFYEYKTMKNSKNNSLYTYYEKNISSNIVNLFKKSIIFSKSIRYALDIELNFFKKIGPIIKNYGYGVHNLFFFDFNNLTMGLYDISYMKKKIILSYLYSYIFEYFYNYYIYMKLINFIYPLLFILLVSILLFHLVYAYEFLLNDYIECIQVRMYLSNIFFILFYVFFFMSMFNIFLLDIYFIDIINVGYRYIIEYYDMLALYNDIYQQDENLLHFIKKNYNIKNNSSAYSEIIDLLLYIYIDYCVVINLLFIMLFIISVIRLKYLL